MLLSNGKEFQLDTTALWWLRSHGPRNRETGSHYCTQKQNVNVKYKSDSTACIASLITFTPNFILHKGWEPLTFWQMVLTQSQNFLSPEALWAKFQMAKNTTSFAHTTANFCCKDKECSRNICSHWHVTH